MSVVVMSLLPGPSGPSGCCVRCLGLGGGVLVVGLLVVVGVLAVGVDSPRLTLSILTGVLGLGLVRVVCGVLLSLSALSSAASSSLLSSFVRQWGSICSVSSGTGESMLARGGLCVVGVLGVAPSKLGCLFGDCVGVVGVSVVRACRKGVREVWLGGGLFGVRRVGSCKCEC